ncbi:hypothetical protein [Criblamydia sequanensis]|uniref:Uncharacterized protein n=1 Tax=Candidatus Criblamydia sequanensis CRIB-18 TaxID=1437425 RepID=A0A090DWV8_9BACT|nr:hypothetical protein [Criblamydia sequanensis]CDR33324.1 hypothetical protein CSEC_0488 [Criblamydia sequanensis CRIB-18]
MDIRETPFRDFKEAVSFIDHCRHISPQLADRITPIIQGLLADPKNPEMCKLILKELSGCAKTDQILTNLWLELYSALPSKTLIEKESSLTKKNFELMERAIDCKDSEILTQCNGFFLKIWQSEGLKCEDHSKLKKIASKSNIGMLLLLWDAPTHPEFIESRGFLLRLNYSTAIHYFASFNKAKKCWYTPPIIIKLTDNFFNATSANFLFETIRGFKNLIKIDVSNCAMSSPLRLSLVEKTMEEGIPIFTLKDKLLEEQFSKKSILILFKLAFADQDEVLAFKVISYINQKWEKLKIGDSFVSKLTHLFPTSKLLEIVTKTNLRVKFFGDSIVSIKGKILPYLSFFKVPEWLNYSLRLNLTDKIEDLKEIKDLILGHPNLITLKFNQTITPLLAHQLCKILKKNDRLELDLSNCLMSENDKALLHSEETLKNRIKFRNETYEKKLLDEPLNKKNALKQMKIAIRDKNETLLHQCNIFFIDLHFNGRAKEKELIKLSEIAKDSGLGIMKVLWQTKIRLAVSSSQALIFKLNGESACRHILSFTKRDWYQPSKVFEVTSKIIDMGGFRNLVKKTQNVIEVVLNQPLDKKTVAGLQKLLEKMPLTFEIIDLSQCNIPSDFEDPWVKHHYRFDHVQILMPKTIMLNLAS